MHIVCVRTVHYIVYLITLTHATREAKTVTKNPRDVSLSEGIHEKQTRHHGATSVSDWQTTSCHLHVCIHDTMSHKQSDSQAIR